MTKTIYTSLSLQSVFLYQLQPHAQHKHTIIVALIRVGLNTAENIFKGIYSIMYMHALIIQYAQLFYLLIFVVDVKQAVQPKSQTGM